MKKIVLLALVAFVWACNEHRTEENQAVSQENEAMVQELQDSEASTPDTTENTGIFGNYVDDGYQKRNEKYDWVAVSVKDNKDNSIHISVRSRADQKKPTCTFDATAYKQSDNTYQSVYDGAKILYTFSEDTLRISAEGQEGEKALHFFCSGGATIGGAYAKINEPLDQSQIDKTSFIKTLNLQNVGFTVSAIAQNGKNRMTVYTFGLPNDFRETFTIENQKIIDAEVEDLNSDGSPELFVFTKTNDASEKGKVHAFSVNNMKSMSMVYFPPTEENKKISEGYRGKDEFAVVENRLVQRFPVYKKEDAMDNPTGGTRQVSYKLMEGEAMRKLEVDQVSTQ